MAKRKPVPPLSELLKSNSVEDPFNVHVHRPIAYFFVKLAYPTRMSPNAFTMLAMLIGVLAGVCWFIGTPVLMVVGGLLLWFSAVIDGADGLLARARGTQSSFGRALDGAADGVVAAASLTGAVWHMWVESGSPTLMLAAGAAIGMTLLGLSLYDHFKEGILNAERHRRYDDELARVQRQAEDKTEGTGFSRLVLRLVLVPALRQQEMLARLLDPEGLRLRKAAGRDVEQDEAYLRNSRGPTKLWVALSLSPHTQIFALCGIFDILPVYLGLRLVAGTGMFITAVFWQRSASRRTALAMEQPVESVAGQVSPAGRMH